MNGIQTTRIVCVGALLALTGCFSDEPAGFAPAQTASVTVKLDMLHKPLPDIPLPNDVATRFDPTSATMRRINASMVAPTALEAHIRQKIDELDGWGLLQPIAIPFTGPIDPQVILDRHRDADYDPSDDAIYLVDITPDSPEYGELKMLDIGNGNYPLGAENRDRYFDNDPRTNTLTIWLEETDEDTNGNGVLDPGEDTDGDGVLDTPNYLPGANPPADDLGARMDAHMTFFEKQTNTLIMIPVVPLRERTTYAVVVTRRLLDMDGNPVGSPYPFVNHNSQTEALAPLAAVMPEGITKKDIAFAFTYTTQTTAQDFVAVRDGLYGHGVQKHIGEKFPPKLATVEVMKDEQRFKDSKNLHLLYSEEFEQALQLLNVALRDQASGSVALDQLLEANKYVDYYMMGSFDGAQLYFREDADGNPLRINDQSWPPDLDRVPADVRGERIYFTLVVPRKEVSVRKDGKPAPVTIIGHGHTGNRFDAVNFGPFFARQGVALIAIDNPGHGLGISEEEKETARQLLRGFGLGPFTDAAFKDRAFDQDFDGINDSGADYWDFYLFHTRDNVRQTALDYMSLIRLLKSFDGERRWDFDLNGDGEKELAGDFDGDGEVDVGAGSSITMTGGSLGGIMSMLMGTVEPEIDAIAPIVGAGGLGLISRRSMNQSVRRAILARVFGPMYLATPTEDGKTLVQSMNPNITKAPPKVNITTIEGVSPGDTMTVTNLDSDERECGKIDANGLGRTPMASDIGDPIVIHFYKGDVQTGPDCALEAGAEPYATIDEFGESITFRDISKEKGETLTALAEGLGHRRATPEFRRFAGLGPLVMDRTDPAVLGRHLQREPLFYPGTGQKTGTHALITTGVGDLNVPVDGAATFARAAGILEWREPHPDWGVPANQVLIDHYVLECIEEYKRYTDPDGNGVLIDPDNFSGDSDLWAGRVPRLDPPLRAGWDEEDALGGRSAAIFAYGDPRGKHGFDPPGEMTDRARKQCEESCAEGEECDCASVDVFDVGNFHFNLIGAYLESGGTELEARACHESFDCSDIPPVPERRTDL
jgi:hypothetical protein